MALQINSLPRVFLYEGKTLADPESTMSPEDVAAYYANLYPELATARVEGPEVGVDEVRYRFVRNFGVKG